MTGWCIAAGVAVVVVLVVYLVYEILVALSDFDIKDIDIEDWEERSTTADN